MLGLVRVALLILCAVEAGCGGDGRQCTYDVDCPIGDRCVATRCVPVQLAPLRDAAPAAEAGTDAEAPIDSGPRFDAGPDAEVDPECTLTVAPAGGVQVSTAESADETPSLVRSGVGLFGLVVRQASGLQGSYLDADGQVVLSPPEAVDGDASVGDFAMTSARDGSMVVVWQAGDDRLHGGAVTDLGVMALGELTVATTGTTTPAIARTSSGFVVAWADRGDGTDHLGTRALDEGGMPVGDESRIATAGSARLPALADVDVDEVPLAWNDARSGTSQPYAATLRADAVVEGEIEVSTATLAGRVAAVATPFGLFLSWVEPPGMPGQQGSVHVSRIEGGAGRDAVIARELSVDGRTSIAWDGDRLFVAWHRGAMEGAEATVAAVRPNDLQKASWMALGAGTARPSVAADDSLRGMVWIDTATSAVMFGTLSCDP